MTRVGYAGRRIALLTQHGKERVIAPVLEPALGCRVELVVGFDTDQLGTFTREIPRAGAQLEAARKKARLGMELSGLALGLASEGSSGPDPMVGMFPWNVEFLIFIDDEQGLETVGVAQGKANHAHRLASRWSEAETFARESGFPEHHLVVRPESENDPRLRKGIAAWAELEAAFAWAQAQSASGRVFLETDLRAYANPTRMEMIRLAAEDLVAKLGSPCPACGAGVLARRAHRRPALRRLRCADPRDPRRGAWLLEVRASRNARAHRAAVRRSGALRLLQSMRSNRWPQHA